MTDQSTFHYCNQGILCLVYRFKNPVWYFDKILQYCQIFGHEGIFQILWWILVKYSQVYNCFCCADHLSYKPKGHCKFDIVNFMFSVKMELLILPLKIAVVSAVNIWNYYLDWYIFRWRWFLLIKAFYFFFNNIISYRCKRKCIYIIKEISFS